MLKSDTRGIVTKRNNVSLVAPFSSKHIDRVLRGVAILVKVVLFLNSNTTKMISKNIPKLLLLKKQTFLTNQLLRKLFLSEG